VRGGCAPFFVPPEAFIYSRLPFEPYWQLLPTPISSDAFWSLPEAAVALFESGGQLLDEGLRAVNVLPACKEGQQLPAVRLPVRFPLDNSDGRVQLQGCLMDAGSGRVVASWRRPQQQQPLSLTATAATAVEQDPPLIFQQRVAGAASESSTHSFGATTFASTATHEIWVAPPAPGNWRIHLRLIRETPDYMHLNITGLSSPLPITLREVEDVVQIGVVVPPPIPHDESTDGPLPDPSTPPPPLPTLTAAGDEMGVQLVTPTPDTALEADRPQLFEIAFADAAAARGLQRVASVVVGAEGRGWTQLGWLEGSSSVFGGEVILPRSAACVVKARAAGDVEGVEVLRLAVLPQVGVVVIIIGPAGACGRGGERSQLIGSWHASTHPNAPTY